MSNASIIAKTSRVDTTIQEYAKKPLQFSSYLTNNACTDTYVYFGSLVGTAVLAATQSYASSGQPVPVTGDSLFSLIPAFDNRPQVANGSQNYPVITIPAANAGMSYAGAIFGFSATDYLRVTVKVSVAMNATVVIQSSTGNSISYTTPNNLPANVWVPVIIPVSAMTQTGTFVYASGAKTIIVTGSAVGTGSVYSLETASTQDSFVGSKWNVAFSCQTSFMEDMVRKLEDLNCGLLVDGTVNTSFKYTVKLTTKQNNINAYLALKGEVYKNTLTMRRLPIVTSSIVAAASATPAVNAKYNGYDVMQSKITNLSGLSMFLSFGETQLNPVSRIEEVLDYSTFFYDSTDGNIYVTQGAYTGRTPSNCNGYSLQQANVIAQRDLITPVYGCVNFGRVGAADREVLALKAQLVDIKPKQSKGVLEHEYTFDFLPLNVSGSYIFTYDSIA